MSTSKTPSRDLRNVDPTAAEPTSAATPDRHVQLKSSLGGLSYDRQQKAVEPQRPVWLGAGPAIQMSPDPSPGGSVQLDTPPTSGAASVPAETQAQVPAGFEWRSRDIRTGKAWYVVKVEPGAAPGEPSQDVHPDGQLSLAADPSLEAWADAFEQALGNLAGTSGQALAAAGEMANKAVAITDAYVECMRNAGAEEARLNELFGKILGGTDPSWAGSVGQEADALRAAASGGLRERVNLAVSFIYQFGAEFVTDTKAGMDMTAFLAEAQAIAGTLDADVDQFTQTIQSRTDAGLAAEAGGGRPLSWVPVVNDDPTVAAQQGTSRVRNEDASQYQSQRTVSDLGQYAQLSQRERELMFPTLAGRSAELGEQRLKWNEGRKVWFINEADSFVQKARAASLPLGGGVSGTTGRIMETAQVFGASSSPVDVRAAAIGYLLPIRAHTLVEILQAASAYGAGPVLLSFALYDQVEPFTNLRGIYSNAEFWKVVDATKARMSGGG